MNSKKKKQKRYHKVILISIFIVSTICLITAIILLLNRVKDKSAIQQIVDNIADDVKIEESYDDNESTLINPPEHIDSSDYWNFIKMPFVSVNFENLLKKNKDTVGWLQVNNTNINYPIVQTSNNEDYLYKAFDGTKNQAGWIFSDYRNNMQTFDKNTIIYGHSRLDKSMFGSLFNTLKQEWFQNKENHVIKLSTPTENTMWQIFSIYKIKAETYYLKTSFQGNEYSDFLHTITSRSIYKFELTPTTDDKIITLSTCSDALSTGRIVVHARLIKSVKR